MHLFIIYLHNVDGINLFPVFVEGGHILQIGHPMDTSKRCVSAYNLCWYAEMHITGIYNLYSPQGSLSTQGGHTQGLLAQE